MATSLCTRLRADPDTVGIPVIFITGLGDVDAEIRALELGAVDYVAKPISPPAVRLRVRNQIELKRARERLEKLADSDGLTGLPNRRHFDRTLHREIGRLNGSAAAVSLILLDIDYFKEFKDRYGHLAGDDCLRRVGHILTSAVYRATDLPARYGGEEFAVLLPNTGLEGAALLAESIRQVIGDARIPHESSSCSDHVSASFGVASVTGGDLSSAALVALADEQLYRAKSGGRNRVAALDGAELQRRGV